MSRVTVLGGAAVGSTRCAAIASLMGDVWAGAASTAIATPVLSAASRSVLSAASCATDFTSASGLLFPPAPFPLPLPLVALPATSASASLPFSLSAALWNFLSQAHWASFSSGGCCPNGRLQRKQFGPPPQVACCFAPATQSSHAQQGVQTSPAPPLPPPLPPPLGPPAGVPFPQPALLPPAEPKSASPSADTTAPSSAFCKNVPPAPPLPPFLPPFVFQPSASVRHGVIRVPPCDVYYGVHAGSRGWARGAIQKQHTTYSHKVP